LVKGKLFILKGRTIKMALTVSALNKQLKSEVKNLYLFYGEEKYLHNLYVERIKKAVLQGPLAQFNFSVFEENSASFERFSNEINTFPQMADKKLILLKNTDFLNSADFQKPIEKILNHLPDYVILVISQYDAKKIKKPLIKTIEAKGIVAEFSKQSIRDLRIWAGKRLGKAGKRITNEDADFLIGVCDCNLFHLETECDKLAAAAGNSEAITKKLITDMVFIPLEFKIFSMAERLLANDSDSAYLMLREFKNNKEAPTVLISLIYSQLSMLYMFKQLKQDAAGYLPPNRKFLAKSLAAECVRHDEKKLRFVMRQCAKFDNDIKNGLIDGWTALELIMAYLLNAA